MMSANARDLVQAPRSNNDAARTWRMEWYPRDLVTVSSQSRVTMVNVMQF